jgi:hypothetical protein
MPAAQLVRFGALAVEGGDDLIGGTDRRVFTASWALEELQGRSRRNSARDASATAVFSVTREILTFCTEMRRTAQPEVSAVSAR